MEHDRWLAWMCLSLVPALGLTAPAPSAAQRGVIETERTFNCSGEVCFTAADRCDRYASDLRDLGRRVAPCRELRQMACFDYYDVADDEELSRCFTSPAVCSRRLREFRRGNYWSNVYGSPRYTSVSECETPRYSERSAQARERAERELAEARARMATMRAEYEALVARREGELLDLALRGAVLSRAVLCDAARAECGFEPARGREPVESAYCMAGVNPNGRIAFVCQATPQRCSELHDGFIEGQRDDPLPLRVVRIPRSVIT